MLVRSIYSPRTVPILWTIFFFYGAAATGRCFLGFSLYSMWKKKKKIKAAIRDKRKWNLPDPTPSLTLRLSIVLTNRGQTTRNITDWRRGISTLSYYRVTT